MKFIAARPFADPEVARKLMEIANSVEPVQEGRIRRSTGRSCPSARVGTGLKLAIERGWLRMHESGAYVKLTDAGAAPFA